MLKIQHAQILAYENSVRLGFEKHIFRLLREHFIQTPVWTSDETVSALVRVAIETADAYGMRDARDAFKFAILMMVFGPTFDQDESWARRILGERSEQIPVGHLLYREGIERVREQEMVALVNLPGFRARQK